MIFLLYRCVPPGDEVWVSDPEGTFDATTKLTQATDFLLLAAGTGELADRYMYMYMYMCMHVHAHDLVYVHAYMDGCIHATVQFMSIIITRL